MVGRSIFIWYDFLMRNTWNKGLTKATHPSILQISQTMRERKIDNFKKWRDKMKRLGKVKSTYPVFKKNGDLAEFMGVILGDGHIGVFPRTEVLVLLSNSNNPGFVGRYSGMLEKIFQKKPYVVKRKEANCIKISIYEKHISDRLGVPSGARKNLDIVVPDWILKNKKYTVRYLRGLYEAEGSFSVHKPTSTYKFSFSNKNRSMLENVFSLVKEMGFHPSRDDKRVQLSRKEEVYRAMRLLHFREY